VAQWLLQKGEPDLGRAESITRGRGAEEINERVRRLSGRVSNESVERFSRLSNLLGGEWPVG